MRARVLLDCDGPLADFHTPCLAIINRLAGTNFTLDDLREWDLFKALGVSGKIKSQTYDEMKLPGWCRDLKPYPGAIEGVKLLREISDVYVCTSPMDGPTWTSERDEWLEHYFGFTTKQIIHCSAKYVCAGDFLVDDKISNLQKWQLHHPHGIAVQWVMPQYVNHVYDGRRTSSWTELADIVQQAMRNRDHNHRIWHHG